MAQLSAILLIFSARWHFWVLDGEIFRFGLLIVSSNNFNMIIRLTIYSLNHYYSSNWVLILLANVDNHVNNNCIQLNFPCVSIRYHPLTGQCAQVNDKNELEFGSCENQKEMDLRCCDYKMYLHKWWFSLFWWSSEPMVPTCSFSINYFTNYFMFLCLDGGMFWGNVMFWGNSNTLKWISLFG